MIISAGTVKGSNDDFQKASWGAKTSTVVDEVTVFMRPEKSMPRTGMVTAAVNVWMIECTAQVI